MSEGCGRGHTPFRTAPRSCWGLFPGFRQPLSGRVPGHAGLQLEVPLDQAVTAEPADVHRSTVPPGSDKTGLPAGGRASPTRGTPREPSESHPELPTGAPASHTRPTRPRRPLAPPRPPDPTPRPGPRWRPGSFRATCHGHAGNGSGSRVRSSIVRNRSDHQSTRWLGSAQVTLDGAWSRSPGQPMIRQEGRSARSPDLGVIRSETGVLDRITPANNEGPLRRPAALPL